MAISRAERRAEREPRAVREYGDRASAVLDVLELTELAWHDCYGETTPPDQVIDDIFTCARSDVTAFIAAARLAVQDFRDLRVTADDIRRG
ncbi:MAG: hypothetical protein QOJ79_1890 [Actinomycetota bacterium]|jgi:hypothetical protein|nr:hypothetical protein [Actinomycetota bacterium]